MEPKKDQDRYERAKKRVRELKDFYSHLIVYAGVNFMLFIINWITSPGAWCFYWVTIFCGIGIMWHAIATFATGRVESKEWEEKKIKELMEKDKEK